MAKVTIDDFYCKGCGLCVIACPKKIMIIAKDKVNKYGSHLAEVSDPEACIGCASCAIICPQVAIKVER